MFEQLIGTSGRINRRGYLARAVLVWIVYGVGVALLGTGSGGLIAVGLLLWVAAIPVGFCAFIRRMHDFGWGGAKILLAFIPLVNILVMLMLYFRPGESGDNEYGNQPVGMSID